MKDFKELITELEILPEEHEEFIYICSDWGLFCKALARYDKQKTMRLMKYIIEERVGSNHLLKRAVGRFNRLNMLTPEVLLCGKV